MKRFPPSGIAIRMAEIVFPADTNHHGTLFGGKGFSLMDRAAFIAATRHGRAPFVTACCERVVYSSPAFVGNIVDLTTEIKQVGRTSLSVEVTMMAEDLLRGTRRTCTSGTFTMVARPDMHDPEWRLPPLAAPEVGAEGDLLLADIVLGDHLSHQGNLFCGDAIAQMTKGAFIVASRKSRCVTVLASSDKIDFMEAVPVGSIIETKSRISSIGRSSITVETELWSEPVESSEKRLAALGSFVMVAVDENSRPVAISRNR